MDVNAMVDSYLSEATEATALRFIDALEEVYAHIGSHPATGSPRYAHELDLPGLRCWSFRGPSPSSPGRGSRSHPGATMLGRADSRLK